MESLRIFLASLPTQTAVATAIQNLIKVLLLHTARSSRCSQLLLGTSLTTLSISLISSISQGAGFTVKEEADENWVSHSHPHATPVKVIRPLQDVGIKECTAWAWWSGILVVGREKIPGSELGIGGLTKGLSTLMSRRVILSTENNIRFHHWPRKGLPVYGIDHLSYLR